MPFDIGLISLGAGQPAGDDVIGRLVPLFGPHIIEGFPRRIELAETQSGRGQIELAVQIMRRQARDLRPPGDGLRAVLFLGCFREDVIGAKRIRPDEQGLMRSPARLVEPLLLEHGVRALEQARFAPLIVNFRAAAQEEEAETASDRNQDKPEGDAAETERSFAVAERLYSFAANAFNLLRHPSVFYACATRDCNSRAATQSANERQAERLPSYSANLLVILGVRGAFFRFLNHRHVLDLIDHLFAQTSPPHIAREQDLDRGC